MSVVTGVRERLRYHPTRKLAVAVVLLSPLWLLTAFDAEWWIAAVAALGILAVAVITDALALPAARDLSVVRELPPTIGVGDSAEGEVLVTARWDAPLRLRMYDQLPVSLEQPVQRKHDVRTIPRGGGTVAFPFTVRGKVRGRWPLGPVVLRAVGPLGLVERSLS
jgi:uncharacterized protein (DUF58 family)